MRLFRRTDRAAPLTAVAPVPPGECSCHEHVDQLRDEVVPLGAEVGDELGEMTVGDLLDCEALGVVPATDAWILADGARRGPFDWDLWFGDEVRAAYDDDAPLPVDESLRRRPGVELVEWPDREVFLLSAPSLCADGVLAAAARALLDPDVRLPRGEQP